MPHINMKTRCLGALPRRGAAASLSFSPLKLKQTIQPDFYSSETGDPSTLSTAEASSRIHTVRFFKTADQSLVHRISREAFGSSVNLTLKVLPFHTLDCLVPTSCPPEPCALVGAPKSGLL